MVVNLLIQKQIYIYFLNGKFIYLLINKKKDKVERVL